jgi:hypothetical protein
LIFPPELKTGGNLKATPQSILLIYATITKPNKINYQQVKSQPDNIS